MCVCTSVVRKELIAIAADSIITSIYLSQIEKKNLQIILHISFILYKHQHSQFIDCIFQDHLASCASRGRIQWRKIFDFICKMIANFVSLPDFSHFAVKSYEREVKRPSLLNSWHTNTKLVMTSRHDGFALQKSY